MSLIVDYNFSDYSLPFYSTHNINILIKKYLFNIRYYCMRFLFLGEYLVFINEIKKN